MEFIRLASVTDFNSQRIQSYRILGKFIAIVKDPDGSFYATEIACKHNNADLTTGKFRGDIVTCSRHGWVYNIRTGECLNHSSSPLRRHALKIEDDEIFVAVAPDEPRDADSDAPFPEITFRNKKA